MNESVNIKSQVCWSRCPEELKSQCLRCSELPELYAPLMEYLVFPGGLSTLTGEALSDISDVPGTVVIIIVYHSSQPRTSVENDRLRW